MRLTQKSSLRYSLHSSIPGLYSRPTHPRPRSRSQNFCEPVFFETLASRLKVNLHSIRFSSVFVRFYTFLLLLDKVRAFSSAFLCVHIRVNQTVTYWTKVFRKNFFVKGYSSISKYRSYRSYTKFLNKIFIYI